MRRRKREKERKRGEEGRFRALESFLQANTDLSTQRHSWKRNLIREKLNSFKCTSRPLFTPYLPPPLFPPALTSLSFASLLLLPPLGVCNPPEQPTWFFLSLLLLLLLLFRRLFLFLPLFRLLLLSATHLYSVNPFHCENVVLQFTLSPHPRFSIRTPYSLSFPLHSSSFLPFFMRRSRTLQFLVSVLSFSFPRFRERELHCQASFLPLHPLIEHCRLHCSPSPVSPPPLLL